MNTFSKDHIFVFGSNLAGRHGKGAALEALMKYKAKYGVGVGRTGDAYAIPTKGFDMETLPIHEIYKHVNNFLAYARENPELKFFITAVGTGLAGHKIEDIAPMFYSAPENCTLPESFNAHNANL